MIRAVIFDLDGTVVDNEQYWEEVFLEVAKRNGIGPPKLKQPNSWWHEPGLGLVQNWRRIVPDRKDAEELSSQTRRLYTERIGKAGLEYREGTDLLVEKIKSRGWQTALATGSHWFMVEDLLEKLQMQLAFDVTITGDEVVNMKPDPEIYLLAAQKLELGPEECLVIEDAIAGIRAAVEAGMKTVGLVSDYAPENLLRAAGAGEVITGMGEVEIPRRP